MKKRSLVGSVWGAILSLLVVLLVLDHVAVWSVRDPNGYTPPRLALIAVCVLGLPAFLSLVLLSLVTSSSLFKKAAKFTLAASLGALCVVFSSGIFALIYDAHLIDEQLELLRPASAHLTAYEREHGELPASYEALAAHKGFHPDLADYCDPPFIEQVGKEWGIVMECFLHRRLGYEPSKLAYGKGRYRMVYKGSTKRWVVKEVDEFMMQSDTEMHVGPPPSSGVTNDVTF